MSQKRAAFIVKNCLLIIVGLTMVGCSNKMLPVTNPPEYQNKLIEGSNGNWHVIPIECPILYDQYGHFDPNSNLGCSQTHNLGMMIANPEDLLGSTNSGNIILHDKRKPLIYRNQPVAKAAQKYYSDKLPKLEDTGENDSMGGFSGVTP